METTFKKLWKAIPIVLLIAFIFTIGDFSSIKRLLMHVDNVVEFQGESIDLSDVKNDYELLNLRTSNTKTFKKINDSYELVLYSEDIHYLADGNYEEIDNTLIEENVNYINKANKFNVKFPKTLNDQNKSEIKYNNNVLQWKFNGANPSYANILENPNKLKYNNLFKNVNLEYVVTNNSVKENIELIQYIEDFSFSYTLYTDLRIERVGDKLELFNDEHQLVYTINEYFMYDASDNMSFDIDYVVSQVNDDEYLVNVIPNNNYLKNATYPVIIDPEIVINNMESVMGAIDVKLFEPSSPNYPNYYPAHYGLDYLTVNELASESSKLYMSIQFPSDSSYPGMSALKNYNFLYSYVTLPNVESNSTTGECTVNARKVNTSSWNNVVPGGAFTVDSEVLASEKFHNNSTFTHRFDIYDYLYDNVEKFGTSFNLTLQFSLDGGYGSYVKYTKPYSYYDEISEFRIGYSNTAGLQDYYTYEELPSSNSSVSYVAHNSGNLTTVYNDYTDGNLINISHVYNSNRSYVLGNYGYGFNINYDERISTYSSSDIKLTKGDGSETLYHHTYVRDESNNIIDEYYLDKDGSGEKIYGASGSYYLITQDNVKKMYNSSNRLYKIFPDTDDLTKYINITFDSYGRIYYITDYNTAISNYNTRVYFYYDSTTSQLKYIHIYRRNESGSTILVQTDYYYYTNNQLTKIRKYDRIKYTYFETCDLTYKVNTNKLESVKDNITNGLKFSYDKANRVDWVEQVIPNITQTPYLNFKYDNNGRRLALQDSNGLEVSYTFDKFFHTKTVTNSLGYTSFTEYNDIYYPDGVYTSSPNYNKNHKIINASQPFKNNVNLISNHSFELSNNLDYWYNSSSSGGTASIIQTSLYGAKALKLYKPTTSATSKAYQGIKVIKDKTYTVSGYIKNPNSTGLGAYINVSSSYITINHQQDAIKGSDEYAYYSLTFTANSTTYVNVYLINDSIGEASFDMIQVNEKSIVNKNNFLKNSSFEYSYVGWSSVSSSEVLSIAGSKFEQYDVWNNYYVSFRGKTIYQTINISGDAGDILIYGGSAYMDNIAANGTVTLTFTYTDGTTSDSSGLNQFQFDSNDQNVQYLMHKAVAEKQYTKIVLKINNTSTNEFLNIDNMALYKEGYGVKLTYTETGKTDEVYNEVTNSLTKNHYNDDDNLDSITENNVKIDVKRGLGNDWVTSIISNNVTKSYKRDPNTGEIDELTLLREDDPDTTENEEEYYFSNSTVNSTNKLYVESQTDEYGRVTQYTYDYLTGLLSSTIFNGVTTEIDYDSLKNITNVSHGSKTITYGYSGKLLTSITVDGLVYSFEYNDYKDITAIKIAGSTVLSNSYKDVNTSQYSGLIDETTYGTDLIRFTYDDEKRIKEVFVNNIKQIEYTYDSIGNIAKIIDYKANPDITYYYNFDEQNRLVTVTSSDGNNVSYEYNPDGYVSGKNNIIGDIDYIYTPIDEPIDSNDKNQNQVLTEEIFGSFSKKYNYQQEGLRKLESTAIITSASSLTSKYTYDSFQKSVDGKTRNYETLRIKELNINKTVNGVTSSLMKFVYTYDNYDNIDTIKRYDNGSSYYNYYEAFYYDSYNQLGFHYQMDNGIEIETEYSYDLRGNITSIVKYIYGDSYETTTISLTYETTGWTDKLKTVTVNGVTYNISNSSTIGNPFYYMGYEIHYDQRLITYIENANSGDIFTYNYNGNGIRTQKNINGSTTNYILEGNKILKESRSDGKVLNYFYDQSGDIIGFKYNNNYYSYVKNLQNDIIGIVDSNGNLIVKYVYDAYGNVLDVIDSSGIGLGNINPFRYKSYYYDIETKFYYLNSRYYDPMIGRFINADDVNMLEYGETNLYAYCKNNPIMYRDTLGYNRNTQNLNETDSGLSETDSSLYFEFKVTPFLLKYETITGKKPNSTTWTYKNYKTPFWQERKFGPDGKATQDVDYTDHNKPDKHPNPHSHDWDWSGDEPDRLGPKPVDDPLTDDFTLIDEKITYYLLGSTIIAASVGVMYMGIAYTGRGGGVGVLQMQLR